MVTVVEGLDRYVREDFSPAGLLGELAALDSDSALRRKLRQYAAPDLLLIDEVGYLSYSNRHADLLFELVSRRYQHKSTVVTTNRAFAAANLLLLTAAAYFGVSIFYAVLVGRLDAGLPAAAIAQAIAAAQAAGGGRVVNVAAFTAASARPKRFCTQSRRRKREARNASVAPMVDANDTSSVPSQKPNRAPPKRVIGTAPGNDSAVIAT